MISRELKKGDLLWVDIVDPSRDDLEKLKDRFGLPGTLIQDCLEPEHLPKFEAADNANFIILRSFDPEADKKSDTVQGLTRKLALFFSDKFLITIHRKAQPFVETAFERWEKETSTTPKAAKITSELLLAAARTFERPVEEAYNKFELFEQDVFAQEKKLKTKDSYLLKRRVAVMKRMLKLTAHHILALSDETESVSQTSLQNIRELVERLIFQLDDIQENLTSLLSLQVSWASQKTNEASHKTNEVMRVLTIFSVFFMPLNFIASIYGMNFENMPELRLTFGYPGVLVIMAAVALSIFLWFRRAGWLKGG